MSIFGDIMTRILAHSARAQEAKTNAAVAENAPAASTPSIQPAAPAASAEPVDVEAVLDEKAAASSQKLDWRHSIVDLMKLVGVDSSLEQRKALAKELGYAQDTSDSAAMNVWLHKQVMQKLSENGGKVPASLLG